MQAEIFPEFQPGGSMGPESDHQRTTTSVQETAPPGSIGVLNGKPIFGPVRPPTLGDAE